MEQVNIFWFRRDLRIEDNHGFFEALNAGLKVLPIFIFDTNILKELPPKDQRVDFIHQALQEIQNQLSAFGSGLFVLHEQPLEAFKVLLSQFAIQKVFFNHDYEPYAKKRDAEIVEFFEGKQIDVHSYKDQVIFEKNEVLKDDGTSYTVFTPYSKRWKATLQEADFTAFPSEKYLHQLYVADMPFKMLGLADLGFNKTNLLFVRPEVDEATIQNYHNTRDIPSIHGTTQLSVHLRFGTLSIRYLAGMALQKNEKFLNELIWRDFYQSILWHFPQVVNRSFKAKYDAIPWRNNEEEFTLWCNGQTGYPIVDAGMRELNTTGWMHNRVRMIVASFLCKHLLIDWRWGEAYFAEKLLDFDLASNNGGWQWAAGCGVDAAPYFRIFNPYLQTQKFDPDFIYIRKWVPEFESFEYVRPIVAHEEARRRCLETYKKALNEDALFNPNLRDRI